MKSAHVEALLHHKRKAAHRLLDNFQDMQRGRYDLATYAVTGQGRDFQNCVAWGHGWFRLPRASSA